MTALVILSIWATRNLQSVHKALVGYFAFSLRSNSSWIISTRHTPCDLVTVFLGQIALTFPRGVYRTVSGRSVLMKCPFSTVGVPQRLVPGQRQLGRKPPDHHRRSPQLQPHIVTWSEQNWPSRGHPETGFGPGSFCRVSDLPPWINVWTPKSLRRWTFSPGDTEQHVFNVTAVAKLSGATAGQEVQQHWEFSAEKTGRRGRKTTGRCLDPRDNSIWKRAFRRVGCTWWENQSSTSSEPQEKQMRFWWGCHQNRGPSVFFFLRLFFWDGCSSMGKVTWSSEDLKKNTFTL